MTALMTGASRCDEVIRLIDEVLGDAGCAPDTGPEDVTPEAQDDLADVEELPGHWGVYYLRPSA